MCGWHMVLLVIGVGTIFSGFLCMDLFYCLTELFATVIVLLRMSATQPKLTLDVVMFCPKPPTPPTTGCTVVFFWAGQKWHAFGKILILVRNVGYISVIE